jgi:hypothetical protein
VKMLEETGTKVSTKLSTKPEKPWLGQETRAMDIRPVEIRPLLRWVQIWDFWFQPPCLCETQSRWIFSACVVPTVKHGGRGVVVWACFAGDTVSDLFRIQGTLKQHGYHGILQRYFISSVLHLVWLSFVFQQDNERKPFSRLCKGYLRRVKESDRVLHQMTWSPQPPDLIEMFWDELDRRVKEKQPTSA